MPLITPPLEGNAEKMLERMRALLDADATLHPGADDLYSGSILPFPSPGPTSDEQVIVSLHSIAGNFNPETLGQNPRVKVAPACLLTVMVYEGEQGDPTATYLRLHALTMAFLWALESYKFDPTPGDSLWHGLTFRQNPTYNFDRDPGKHQLMEIVFSLTQQSKTNC